MKLLDLNVLVYAVNVASPFHERAKPWLDATLAGPESVAIPWAILTGFLRISTDSRIMPQPLSAVDALGVVDEWLALPSVSVVHPGDDHWTILRDLIRASGGVGKHFSDAHLAALAIEHECELCSADTDFARYRRLRWVNPLAA